MAFDPVVMSTKNVATTLSDVAQKVALSSNELDFALLGVTTTMVDASGEKEPQELDAQEAHCFSDEAALLNASLSFDQEYEVRIALKESAIPLGEFEASIGANATLTKIFLSIKKGSVLRMYDLFEHDFLDFVQKKMLRVQLLIELFDAPLLKSASELKQRLQEEGTILFEENMMIEVAQGIEPILPQDDQLIKYFEQRGEGDDRIDYSKRSFLTSCVQDELIIEYKKARTGKPGRNCKGEYIDIDEPLITQTPQFSVSDKFSVHEDEESITYRAKESGYIIFENGTYDIAQDVEVSEISFKSTGSVETQLDADVSISVTEKDVMKDAVGMGMEVEVKSIDIAGNIGPNATVKAQHASIGGQVHQSANVEADELFIKIHKGSAKGVNVEIERLEHGIVEGDKVVITQATGGEIRAREIHIKTLGANVQATAVNTIEIDTIKGEENRLIIDPIILSNDATEFEGNSELIKKERFELKALQKKEQAQKQKFIKNKPVLAKLQAKLKQYKANKINIPDALKRQYKQFTTLKKEIEALEADVQMKQRLLQQLTLEHEAFGGNIEKARVINHDLWRGYNQVIFKLVEPKIELQHMPNQGDKEEFLAVVYDEESDEYSIQSVQE